MENHYDKWKKDITEEEFEEFLKIKYNLIILKISPLK